MVLKDGNRADLLPLDNYLQELIASECDAGEQLPVCEHDWERIPAHRDIRGRDPVEPSHDAFIECRKCGKQEAA